MQLPQYAFFASNKKGELYVYFDNADGEITERLQTVLFDHSKRGQIALACMAADGREIEDSEDGGSQNMIGSGLGDLLRRTFLQAVKWREANPKVLLDLDFVE